MITNEFKGNFEWEDDDDLCSTLYDVLIKCETPDECIEFLEIETPYRDMLNKKVKDVIKYRVYVYMAATDCDGTYVGDNFKTLESAKSFAEQWYCNEIKKFFNLM